MIKKIVYVFLSGVFAKYGETARAIETWVFCLLYLLDGSYKKDVVVHHTYCYRLLSPHVFSQAISINSCGSSFYKCCTALGNSWFGVLWDILTSTKFVIDDQDTHSVSSHCYVLFTHFQNRLVRIRISPASLGIFRKVDVTVVLWYWYAAAGAWKKGTVLSDLCIWLP